MIAGNTLSSATAVVLWLRRFDYHMPVAYTPDF
jgi:hypothetical protein